MPETIPKLRFAQELLRKARLEQFPLQGIPSLARTSGEVEISYGGENAVLAYPGKLDRVVAISYDHLTPGDAKRWYYLQGFYSTVFPYNFPCLYGAFSGYSVSSRGSIPVTVRKRIRPAGPKVQVKFPFSDVIKICQELDIPLSYDPHPTNFSRAQDGGEYYVDRVYYKGGRWNLPAIEQYLDANNFGLYEKKKVFTKLERLELFGVDTRDENTISIGTIASTGQEITSEVIEQK